MISLDHVTVWSNNLFDTTYRLSAQTGIGNRDSGFSPRLGLGHKVMPLGGDAHIEIQSVVDHDHVLGRSRLAVELERQIAHGDSFVGWSLRTDDKAELEEFARHRAVAITEDVPGGALAMSGPVSAVAHAPDLWNSWLTGLPNLCHIPDVSDHASRVPIQDGTGHCEGTGVIAIEIGGSVHDLKRWLGEVCDPRTLPLEIRYNGGRFGLYEVVFDTTAGTRSIRLNPVSL